MVDGAAPVWADEYGFRVLAPALPGLAGSPPVPLGEYLPSALARIVLRDVSVRGVDRFALVGFSWGASIGAQIDPSRLRALVSLDTGYQTYDDIPTLEERLAQFADADFADPVVVGTAFHGVDQEPAADALHALAEADVPILLLVATEPFVRRRVDDLARFRERVPGAEVREIAGGEHNLLETSPQEVVPLVGDWLRRVTIGRA